MGNEMNLPKLRTVSPYDSSKMQNNYQPLRFHRVHGENIKLSKDGAIACRYEGFSKGIVFSDRPVMIKERICIKFVEISGNWSGALRIGFTTNDPNSIKSKLPRYACPDLTSMNGNWAKAIAERLAKKNSVLFYFVDENGDVHYGIDSEEYGIFFSGVNISEKLWAVLDIYGNTTVVEFVEQRSAVQDLLSESDRNFLSLSSNTVQVGSKISFHSTHGRNVILKFNRLVAARKKSASNSCYVFTERPVNINERLLIKIMSTDSQNSGSFIYGLTACNPSNIIPDDLPINAEALVDRLEYWVVRNDAHSYVSNDVITFCINEEGQVNVVKNLTRLPTFFVDETQPLWFFFDISSVVSEICVIEPSESQELVINNQFSKLTVSLTPENEIAGASGEDANSEKVCVVCFEVEANVALYRCGHVCMCYDCAHKIWKPASTVQCPICREVILDVLKIYT